jgi:hypothetical protein
MEGMSLGGELVLVSACLTVTPLITEGQAHTQAHHKATSAFLDLVGEILTNLQLVKSFLINSSLSEL